MRSNPTEAQVNALLRAYLDAVTLAEPLQGRIWAASQLTLTQVRALRRLARGPKPVGQLGAELGLTPPSITRVIDRLEERGLIERRRDEADRRRVVAAILPAGTQVVSSMPLLHGSTIQAAVARMAPADLSRMTAAFAEFIQAVREAEETDVEEAAG